MWTIILIFVLVAIIGVLFYLLFCFSDKIDQLNGLKDNTYSVGITRMKREDTDIRVLQVYARDELSIQLQKDGLITYDMKEKYREDIKETEVKVTASINLNKINS